MSAGPCFKQRSGPGAVRTSNTWGADQTGPGSLKTLIALQVRRIVGQYPVCALSGAIAGREGTQRDRMKPARQQKTTNTKSYAYEDGVVGSFDEITCLDDDGWSAAVDDGGCARRVRSG
jgi:hypothetical protein